MSKPVRVPELLAPAGSYESMTAAVNAGADAVYMGGTRFGARAYAESTTADRLREAVDFMHLRGRKLYLTVNTLLKEQELLEDLPAYLRPLYEQGLDAVIVQDLGVLAVIREEFPLLPVHMSTQAAVMSPEGVRLLRQLGVKRTVLPRELSLPEIREICRIPDMETEVFVHGALCYCYSGQCLMSSFLGGRSGNRGRCAQPCRLPYEGGRLLNLRDLCAADLLPQLAQAGVDSLKIEGRMKTPQYTAGVVSVYRRLLDELAAGRETVRADAQEKAFLSALFDRGGFTDGYFRRHNGAGMVIPDPPKEKKSSDPAMLAEAEKRCDTSEHPLPVQGEAAVREGAPLCLAVRCGDTQVCVTGEPVTAAKTQPLAAGEIRRALEKTGGSDFAWENLSVETDGRSFVPVAALNRLRREAFARLREELLGAFVRKTEAAGPLSREELPGESVRKTEVDGPLPRSADAPASAAEAGELSVSLEEPDLLDTVLRCGEVSRVILFADIIPAADYLILQGRIRSAGKEAWYCLPRVMRSSARAALVREADLLRKDPPDGWLIPSWDGLAFLREQDLPGKRLADAGFYTWNRAAKELLLGLGIDRFTCPAELTERELPDLSANGAAPEMIVVGRLPMMLSAQCVRRTRGRCLREAGEAPDGRLAPPEPLRDRTGAVMPVRTLCRFCMNIIYNAHPLWLADLPLPGVVKRISLTDETPAQARAILDRLSRCARGEDPQPAPPEGLVFTRGHLRRGVQ